MPEYLAPGVYVEEVSFRAKSIEGVSTSTTGFVGPTRFGPVAGEPELLTSFNQFERIYGGLDQLTYSNEPFHNFLAHAVRAYFDNGGRRLYVARAFTEAADDGMARQAKVLIPYPYQSADAGVASASAALALVERTLMDAVDAANAALESALLQLRQGNETLRVQLETLDWPRNDAPATAADDLQTFIDNLRNGTAEEQAIKAQATAAFTPLKPLIATAIEQRTRATSEADPSLQKSQADAQASIEGAMKKGRDAADAVPPPAQSDAPGFAGAAEEVRTAATKLAATQATTRQPVANLVTAQRALAESGDGDRAARIAAVIAAVKALLDSLVQVITDAGALAAPAEKLARVARQNEKFDEPIVEGRLRARFPGQAGNMSIRITARLTPNILTTGAGDAVEMRQTRHRDLVFRTSNNTLYTALRDEAGWQLSDESDTRTPLSALNPNTDQLRVLTFGVEVRQPGQFTQPLAWNDLTIATEGRTDSITSVFAEEIPNRLRELETPLVVLGNTPPPLLARGLIGAVNLGYLIAAVVARNTPEVTSVYQLSGGNDGQRPAAEEYAGDETGQGKTGLVAFEDLEDISIVAAPGVTFDAGEGQPYSDDAEQVTQQLIIHCERMRYRVAVLDSPNDQSVGAIRTYRATLDNTRAALYYPWVRILDPLTREELNVPPSGFIAGIYARNDTERGVHKAPANEVVLGAIGLETPINQRQQEVLNPLGINCLRFFENRGNRVWGARTVSSDPEWKYLNIRRYFAYLEASIERSTQWAVFEPNGEALWANVRRAVSDFLFNEWKSGRLAGAKPEEAFFVQCDRSTITQNDLDNGRMICLIGVAPLYPAEFVIFRIGQWTGDRRA